MIDPEKCELAWTIPWDADWVRAVALPDGSRLAAANGQGQILLWDLPGTPGGPVPAPCRRLDGHTNAVTGLVPAPGGKRLVSSSLDHTLRVWDLDAAPEGREGVVLQVNPKKGTKAATVEVGVQKTARVIDAHREWIRSLAASADGARLLSGDDAGLAVLWELPEVKEARRLQVPGWIQAAALSKDGRSAVTCEYAPRYATFPNAIQLWDLAEGKVRFDLGREFKRNDRVAGMGAAAFSRDDRLVALGQGGEVEGANGKIHLVETASGKKVQELAGHQYGVTALAFHPDGRHLLSAGRDTLVRVWGLEDGKMAKELGKARGGQFKDWNHALALSPDGGRLAVADMAGAVHVWQLGG